MGVCIIETNIQGGGAVKVRVYDKSTNNTSSLRCMQGLILDIMKILGSYAIDDGGYIKFLIT